MAAGPAQCSRKGPGLGEEGEEGKGREGAGGGTTRRSRHGGAGRRRAGGGRPAAAALHRGGDAEAALPAAGAPDDRAVLGEVHGQAGAEAGQPCRDVLRQLRGALHRHQPVHPQPAGADAEVQVGLLGEPVRLSAAPRAAPRCEPAVPSEPRSPLGGLGDRLGKGAAG